MRLWAPYRTCKSLLPTRRADGPVLPRVRRTESESVALRFATGLRIGGEAPGARRGVKTDGNRGPEDQALVLARHPF